MYKVFFKDRTVFFNDNFQEIFRVKSGLFYKYESPAGLADIIDMFFQLTEVKNLYLFHKEPDALKREFASNFRIIRAAGGLVRNSKGEYMAILRNGIWDLPKGKTEKGETPQQSAAREVSEECGIDPPGITKFLLKTYHTYILDGTPVLKETDWFEMRVAGNVETTPQLQENITEIRWFGPGDTMTMVMNTYPSILEVLREGGII